MQILIKPKVLYADEYIYIHTYFRTLNYSNKYVCRINLLLSKEIDET